MAVQSNNSKACSLSALPYFLSIKTSGRDSFQPLYHRANQRGLSHARISGQEQSIPRSAWCARTRMLEADVQVYSYFVPAIKLSSGGQLFFYCDKSVGIDWSFRR